MNTNQNGITDMYIVHEILSRARINEPQKIHTEASRSARQISIRARKQAARERNGW